jgi:transcriptional regulator with XRE-family HTH domain
MPVRFNPIAFKQRREALLLTQDDLVLKTKLSGRTISRAENGENISIESAAQLTALLDIEVEAETSKVVTGSDNPGPEVERAAPQASLAPPVTSASADPAQGAAQQWPIAGFTNGLSKRDFILGSFALASAVFGGLNFAATKMKEWSDEEKRTAEHRELAYRLFFGDSETQYYVPSINNPYSPIKGITAPTGDALTFLFKHFGFGPEKFRPLTDPRTSKFDGSIMLLGGPVANVFSRQLMGTGAGCPLFSHVHSKPVTLPISFDNVVSSEIGAGNRPRYEIRVAGRKLDGLDSADSDFLVLTSIPNVFSPCYGLFDHRITVAAGWHGAGTRAIGLVLSQPKFLAQLHEKTKGLTAWQALIKVGSINRETGVPTRIGESAVFEIGHVDFGRVRDAMRGESFWIHPQDMATRA